MAYCNKCGREIGDSAAHTCQPIVYYPDPVHRPWKCPVCDGAGKVSRPPYIAGDQQSWASSGIKTYPCTSCGGTGIVWG